VSGRSSRTALRKWPEGSSGSGSSGSGSGSGSGSSGSGSSSGGGGGGGGGGGNGSGGNGSGSSDFAFECAGRNGGEAHRSSRAKRAGQPCRAAIGSC
jgi:hypothetical protein